MAAVRLFQSVFWIFLFSALALSKFCVLSAAAGAARKGVAQCATAEFTRAMLNDPCNRPPESLLEVQLDPQKMVSCGEFQALEAVSSKTAPKITFKKAEAGKMYALMMLDPNAPRHGDLFWRHWLVSDIPGEALQQGSLTGATTLTEYKPPAPPAGSGEHHYQFFLFEQAPATTGRRVSAPSHHRGRFDAVQFVRDNELCTPVASAQFITERK